MNSKVISVIKTSFTEKPSFIRNKASKPGQHKINNSKIDKETLTFE